MKNNKKILAIIPARSGSKGLLNKNIKVFNKKPLIYWTINEALKSQYIDKCFVTTDSKKIAKLSLKYGADASFLRPKQLSNDKSKVSSAITHVIKKLKPKYDIVILLQPTSPLRDVKDIDNSLKIFIEKKLTSLISVSDLDYPYQWILNKNKSNFVKFIKNNKLANRQAAKKYFKANGAIYIAKINNYMESKNFFTNKTYGYYMKPFKSIDIDNELDFKIAEIIKKNNV